MDVKMTVFNFLKFEEWLPSRDADINWITVAQSIKEKGVNEKNLFTISILVEKIEFERLLDNEAWFSMVDFGNTELWTDEKVLRYNSNFALEKDGINVSPFVIYRTWFHKSLDSEFEIIQDFLLFYNLCYDSKSKMFKAISEAGEEYDVIKLTNEENNKKIEINTKFLRNYLAIKNMILVRQHDHTRFTNDSLKLIIGKVNENYIIKNESSVFGLSLAENPCPSYTSFSRLLGKDIILPFDQGKAILEWGKKFSTFKIGQNDQGNDIEETCNEEELSNYFVNRGKPRFLTPVYFEKEVLKRYYDSPSKYSVSSNTLSCDGLWSINIDTTDKGFIQVWLGDLGKIPFKEQKHWKLFNIVSDGKITQSRFKRDFMAEFADSEDLMFKFHKSFSSFQKNFKLKYGFDLFTPLKNEDISIYNSLRVPVNNELPEFEGQISSLAKLLPDSIDISSIKKYLKEKGTDDKIIEDIKDKKIRALELFTESKNELIQVLDKIQHIRSKHGSAHKRGEDSKKILEKCGFINVHNSEIFKKILNDLIKVFENYELK